MGRVSSVQLKTGRPQMLNPSREFDTGPRPKAQGGLSPALNRPSEELGNPTQSDPEHFAITAVTEIDKLMEDLRSARDYLKEEAERIQRETAQLKTMSKAALASVHLVSGNLSKWRGDQKAA